MMNRWDTQEEKAYIEKHLHIQNDEGILQQAYATRLLGSEPDLTMHGGGNTSVKASLKSITGKEQNILYIKASGTPLSTFTPEHFVGLDLDFLRELKMLDTLSDEIMAREFKLHQLMPHASLPSIESLMHAFNPARFVDHTHPSAILAIANRENGQELLKEAFGDDLAILPYTRMGFDLAKATSEAVIQCKGCKGLLVIHHGLVTWGNSAREAYDSTIELVNRAEHFLATKRTRKLSSNTDVAVSTAHREYADYAPILRGILSPKRDNPDFPRERIVLRPLYSESILRLLHAPEGKELLTNPPLTPDYPMLTRILPLWVDIHEELSPDQFRYRVESAVHKFTEDYRSYLLERGVNSVPDADLLPRVVIIPELGAICWGRDDYAAGVVSDLTNQAFLIRQAIYETGGTYESVREQHLFDMQYRSYQRAKAVGLSENPLKGSIALVIGSQGNNAAICQKLLSQGCHVILTNKTAEQLDPVIDGLKSQYSTKITGLQMDCDSATSVSGTFQTISKMWGGIDLCVVSEKIDCSYALEEAIKVFNMQKTGGDIILTDSSESSVHLQKLKTRIPADSDIRLNAVSSSSNDDYEARAVLFFASRQLPLNGITLQI